MKLSEEQSRKERARVGAFDQNKFEVYIYPENFSTPSFHLMNKNRWELVLSCKDFSVLDVKKKAGNERFQKGESLPKDVEHKDPESSSG